MVATKGSWTPSAPTQHYWSVLVTSFIQNLDSTRRSIQSSFYPNLPISKLTFYSRDALAKVAGRCCVGEVGEAGTTQTIQRPVWVLQTGPIVLTGCGGALLNVCLTVWPSVGCQAVAGVTLHTDKDTHTHTHPHTHTFKKWKPKVVKMLNVESALWPSLYCDLKTTLLKLSISSFILLSQFIIWALVG